MTVFDNIAFGLTVLPRRERPNAAAIKAKVTKLLEMVQLALSIGRSPLGRFAGLAGGIVLATQENPVDAAAGTPVQRVRHQWKTQATRRANLRRIGIHGSLTAV